MLDPTLQVGGLTTNQAFLRRLAAHLAFAAAELDTAFIGRYGAELTAVPALAPQIAALAAMAAHALSVHGVRRVSGMLCSLWE
jgi:3-methylcrotonyl-CoA carboxylase alpha subunit